MNEQILKKMVRFENHHLVDESFSKSKGTFFLSGHFSNWELMAFSYPLFYKDKLSIIAKIQASRGLDEEINKYRELSGNEIIKIGFSLKKIFEKLNNNQIVCFLVDQSAHPDYSVYVNLFGKKVATFSGPAKIALRQRPGLLLAYGIRGNDYKYKINFEKIIYDDLIDSSKENIIELTQRIQSGFEKIISENPDQWLWFHKRFKHIKN